jgi:hypothetical protein
MKAYYTTRDRDYFILFEKGEIDSLLQGKELNCFLYIKSPEIQFERRAFTIKVLEKQYDLYIKSKELEKQRISFDYTQVLISRVDDSRILYLSKEWLIEGFSQEVIDRCGKNGQRYDYGGATVHFYSMDSKHTKQQAEAFEIEELIWTGKYGENLEPST